jgi:anion-transporting  ArsA/GET3 family ATPase
LHLDPRFDLVVVDTPPTRSAIDFVEAPDRLARFLEHKLFRILIAPSVFGMKVVSNTLQPIVRTIGRVVGGDAIADAVEFLKAFGGMEQGFRERARQSDALLRDPHTAFLLVATGRRDTLEEARYFVDRLATLRIHMSAVVANRMPPRFGNLSAEEALSIAVSPSTSTDESLMYRNLAELQNEAAEADANMAEFRSSLDAIPYVRIAERADDICDLAGITELAHAFAR